jgi:CheY-like chemotaxis protein
MDTLAIEQPLDNRPVIRIAGFGLAEKFHRMIEIVLKHARHNPYRYVVTKTRGAQDFDLALVDMTVRGAPEVAATLARLPEQRPVVTLGRRRDGDRPMDDLWHGDYLQHLVKVLNGAVENAYALRQRLQALWPTVSVALPPATPYLRGSDETRVLVVDDSPTVQRQLSLALQQLGLSCDTVAGADEALEALTLRRYELVFTDLVMPGVDGFKLTRMIKKDRALKQVPVIMLTSKSSPIDLARGALAGCNSYLVKPVAMQNLRNTVRRHLKRATKAGQS